MRLSRTVLNKLLREIQGIVYRVGMTFSDAVQMLSARPDKVAIAPSGKVIKISNSGFIMEAFSKRPRSYRPRLIDVLGATWTCFTPEELRMRAEQAEIENANGEVEG